jgi:hypothetical protein
MQMQHEPESKSHRSPNGNGSPSENRYSLDDLLTLEPAALEKLYRDASVPRIADLQGDLRGRMLAIPAIKGAAASILRAFAGSARFPWRGKSFTPLGADRGEGINRVFTDRLHLFRFETFVAPSRAGSFDAVQLDYDKPGNPFFIRAIKDEIRQLAPGLYLGQAYVMIKDQAHLGLYFGLERA